MGRWNDHTPLFASFIFASPEKQAWADQLWWTPALTPRDTSLGTGLHILNHIPRTGPQAPPWELVLTPWGTSLGTVNATVSTVRTTVQQPYLFIQRGQVFPSTKLLRQQMQCSFRSWAVGNTINTLINELGKQTMLEFYVTINYWGTHLCWHRKGPRYIAERIVIQQHTW